MKIDCSDKTCSLEYRVLPTCVMYQPNEKTNCDIPCNLANCSVEVRHFFDCPVWTCQSKGSTTTPAPLTPITLAPLPRKGHGEALFYSSVAFNILFFGFALFAIFQIRKLRRLNRTRRLSTSVESGIIRNSFTNPASDAAQSDLRHFSIHDSNEGEPLLSGRAHNPPTAASNDGPEPAQASLLQRLQNFRWSFASRSWIETQPENNELSPISSRNVHERSEPSRNEPDTAETQFRASAPVLNDS